jgi:hypothetical protein
MAKLHVRERLLRMDASMAGLAEIGGCCTLVLSHGAGTDI